MAAASAAVNQALQAAMQPAVTAGQLPIVLAGSCDAAIGVIAGLDPGALRRGLGRRAR